MAADILGWCGNTVKVGSHTFDIVDAVAGQFRQEEKGGVALMREVNEHAMVDSGRFIYDRIHENVFPS